jgi:hypothetical protein
MRTTTFQLSDLKRALIKMIDLKLKSYTVNGMVLTKEQVTELIDDHVEIQSFKEIAIFDERLDRSEMFCQIIDSNTLAYSVMQDDNQGYTVSWDFKVNLN